MHEQTDLDAFAVECIRISIFDLKGIAKGAPQRNSTAGCTVGFGLSQICNLQGGNASAHSTRLVGSTLSDPYAPFSAFR